MHIRVDKQKGTVLLAPTNRGERRVMTNAIGIIATRGGRLSYGGRIGTDEDPVKAIILYAGGYSKRVTRVSNGGQFPSTRSVHFGLKILLRGTTPTDQRWVFPLRDACYWGSGGLILLRAVSGGAALFTAKRCKHCKGPMIDRASCEWSVCGTCALVCEHEYVRGAIRGGGIDIGMGMFCDKCGRGRPKDPHTTPLPLDLHHMAVQAELDIHVVEAPTRKEADVEIARRIGKDLDSSAA